MEGDTCPSVGAADPGSCATPPPGPPPGQPPGGRALWVGRVG